MPRQRIPTGIKGLDEIISGGFEEGKTYLVTGETGTGKTIFSLQFLLHGISLGENAIFLTIDENPDHLIDDAESLGWDLKKPIDEGKFLILDMNRYFSIGREIESISENIFYELRKYVEKINAKRIVVDPLVPPVLITGDSQKIRKHIKYFIAYLDQLSCTSIVTSEIPAGSNKLSRYGVEEAFVSGIIVLSLIRQDTRYVRALLVRKMRGTPLDLVYQSFTIQPRHGIVLAGPMT